MSQELQNNTPDIRAILAELAQALQAEALARIQERKEWIERMERIEKNVEAISADVRTLVHTAMSHTDRLNKLEGL